MPRSMSSASLRALGGRAARQLQSLARPPGSMRAKIQHAMARREAELMLRGIVELDEAFYRRQRAGSGRQVARSATQDADCVAASQSAKGGLGAAHLEVIDNAKAATLTGRCQGDDRALAPRAHRRLPGYARLAAKRLRAPRPRVGEWDTSTSGLPWSHIVLANFKRWLLDSSTRLPGSPAGYLDEFCYRLNRRGERLDLFPSRPQTAACCTPSRRRIRC